MARGCQDILMGMSYEQRDGRLLDRGSWVCNGYPNGL